MASDDDSRQRLTWETVPSYNQLYYGLEHFLTFFANNSGVLSLSTQYDHISRHHRLDTSSVLLVLTLAIVWTCMRHLSTKHIFEPIGRYFKLTRSNQEKMPESAWKCLFYTGAWLLTFYSAVWKHGFFQRPSSVWDNWNLDFTPSTDIYLIYLIQSSFYLHSMYATVFVDVWRKDSMLLIFHHIVTFGLLAFSHAFRYNNIGVLVLLFHDFCDIILEFTKVNVYFKIRDGVTHGIHELIANVGFVVFTVSWYTTRLYWFPLKAIYVGVVIPLAANMGLAMPLLFTMNSLLWVVLAMDIYWFMLVLSFLYRVAIGQIKEVDDTREYDVEEKIKQKFNKVQANGNVDHQKIEQSNSNSRNGNAHNGHYPKSENSKVRARSALKT